MSAARDDLLDRIIGDVAAHGLGDRSLRDLAAGAGTSHRMLLYHFGSRPGLVAAIVERIEADQRDALAAMATGPDAANEPDELVRRLWQRVSSPELLPFVRLFFETVSHRSPADGDDDLTSAWLERAAGPAEATGIVADPVDIRLGVAVTRGLLVDLVAGADRAEVEAALERFLDWWRLSRAREER